MRILYISQYFPPESGATQTRAYEMARNLVSLGHSVTMLAEVPNHPSGIIPPHYRGKLFERADLEGIDVIRVWVKASPEKNFRNRMAFYLTFMVNAALAGLFLARSRYDILYVSSPPLFVGGSALVLNTLRHIPMVFEVRDLWPESAVALGEISSQRAIAWATQLEEACYRRARRIVVVTQGIYNRLIERDLPPEKVTLIPNGANVDLFQFNPAKRDRIRDELNLQDAFIVIYAGIFGVAQGLETIVEAARQLHESQPPGQPKIHFVMIGDGPKRSEITALAERYGLPNLTLLPEQPREKIPAYLSAADAAIIPLRNLDLFKGALPSKMFDAWACQRPVLLSVDGEARQALEAAEGGLFIPPEDPTALAQAALHLAADPAGCQRMGLNGRAYTEQNYSRRTLALKLAQLLQDISSTEET